MGCEGERMRTMELRQGDGEIVDISVSGRESGKTCRTRTWYSTNGRLRAFVQTCAVSLCPSSSVGTGSRVRLVFVCASETSQKPCCFFNKQAYLIVPFPTAENGPASVEFVVWLRPNPPIQLKGPLSHSVFSSYSYNKFRKYESKCAIPIEAPIDRNSRIPIELICCYHTFMLASPGCIINQCCKGM